MENAQPFMVSVHVVYVCFPDQKSSQKIESKCTTFEGVN